MASRRFTRRLEFYYRYLKAVASEVGVRSARRSVYLAHNGGGNQKL